MRLVPLVLLSAAAAAGFVLSVAGVGVLGAREPLVATPLPSPVPAEVAAGVALVEWTRGLSKPLALVAPPGEESGRLWVVEKTGAIRVLGPDGKVVGGPVLDLTGKVAQRSEQGLLGLAFHPDFATNRLFYASYTDLEGHSRVVEYREAGGTSERVRDLLYVMQPYSNHNGGNVAMGPDRRLWVGLGDGGAANDPHGFGQNKTALLGKMLRLDPAAPQPRAEIAFLGMRNPWRYSFDRKTGDLYIGDVGQNRFEEVDVLAAGTTSGNLGWNIQEGFACFEPRTGCRTEGLVQPVLVYRTGHDGCTVVGGYVYRGTALPALDGAYFFADYCTGLLRSFRWKGAGQPIADYWDWKEALDPKDKLAEIASFGEDAQGELYVVSLDGVIRKLVPAPSPSPSPSPESSPTR